jgi:hypothetical protein
MDNSLGRKKRHKKTGTCCCAWGEECIKIGNALSDDGLGANYVWTIKDGFMKIQTKGKF